MYLDDVFFADLALETEFDCDEFRSNYRDAMGTYRVGSFELDPQMDEYEDLLDLGMSLRD